MANSRTPAVNSRFVPSPRWRLLSLLAVMGLLIGVLIVQRSQRRPAPSPVSVAKVGVAQLLFPQTPAALSLQEALKAQPNNARGHLELGLALAEQGFNTAALQEYRTALKQGLQTADVHRALAQTYERLSRRAEAVQEYRLTTQLDPGQPWRTLELARALYRDGQTKETLQILGRLPAEIEKLTPPADRLPFWRTLGTIYAEIGDMEQCQRTAEKILTIAPSDPASLQIKAQGFISLGKSAQAVPLLEQALATIESAGPQNTPPPQIIASLHYLIGGALYETQGVRAAEEILGHLNRAIQQDPGQGWAFYTQARVYADLKRWKEAADAFLNARSVGIETPDLLRRAAIAHRQMGDTAGSLLLKGMYHQAQGENPQAIKTYTDILATPEYREAAALQIARVHRQEHDYARALAALQDLIAHKPDSVAGYQALIDLYGDKGDLTSRTATLKRLLEIAPSTEAYVYRELGAMSYSAQRHEEAEQYFEKCARLDPNDPAYHFAVARACLQQTAHKEKTAKALESLELTLSLAPHHTPAYRLLGQALQQSNRLEEAARAYERSIDLEPGRGDAYAPLIALYRSLGRAQDAQEIARLFQRYQKFHATQSELERLVVVRPKDRQARLKLANFYLHAKDYNAAAEQLEKSARLAPSDPTIQEALATCYSQMGKLYEANRAMQRALQLRASGKASGSRPPVDTAHEH